MKRLACMVCMAGMLFAAGAMAQDKGTTPDTQKSTAAPKANETVRGSTAAPGGPGTRTDAKADTNKADAKAENKRINDEYTAARKACKPMKGAEQRSCEKQAKDKRDADRKAMKTASTQTSASAARATPVPSTATPPASTPSSTQNKK